MARSTFEGPILSGDNRFGALRDVGYARLTQFAGLDFSNTTSGTANYSGASGQFVVSNSIPNLNGNVYTPSSTVYPPVVATPTADSATAIYRGVVFYMPINSHITAIDFDIATFPTISSGTLTSVQLLVGNQFNGAQYAQTSALTSGTGRQTVSYSGTQLANCQATSSDITNNQQPALLSQVIPYTGGSGTTLPVITAGTFTFAVRYTQLDTSIGNATTYPYGNFD